MPPPLSYYPAVDGWDRAELPKIFNISGKIQPSERQLSILLFADQNRKLDGNMTPSDATMISSVVLEFDYQHMVHGAVGTEVMQKAYNIIHTSGEGLSSAISEALIAYLHELGPQLDANDEIMTSHEGFEAIVDLLFHFECCYVSERRANAPMPIPV